MCYLLRRARSNLWCCTSTVCDGCGIEPNNGLATHDLAMHGRRFMVLWFVVGVLATIGIQTITLAMLYTCVGLWYVVNMLFLLDAVEGG